MMAPFATSEEDGGFGIYGDKTRYATLQKKRETTTVANNHPRGYETMRNLRTSIPSLVSIFWERKNNG